MRRVKGLMNLMVISLISILFYVQGEAKTVCKPTMNRVLINGKIVLDTHYSKNIENVVRKNLGQTIVIMPISSYSGLWQQRSPYKVVRGKMLSLFVNGKPVLDSKVPYKIYAMLNKHIGKRIVLKQRDKNCEEYSPLRLNIVLTGPYSKEVLQDFLITQIIPKITTKAHSTKVIKQWADNDVIYNQYKNGCIISFSCTKTTGEGVRIVSEMLKRDYVLNIDWIHINLGKNYFENLKQGIGYFSFVQKDKKVTYEEIYKAVDSFSIM